MDVKTLIETLVRLGDEDLIAKLHDLALEYINIHQTKLNELKQELGKKSTNPMGTLITEHDKEEIEEYFTISDKIERILQTAGCPLGKREIMKRYKSLYGETPSENSIGGALFKKKGILFERVGKKGPRYAKWRLMPEVQKKPVA